MDIELSQPTITEPRTVICVDLDGTLIAGDIFWETLLRFAIASPWNFLQIALWSLRGRAYLKKQVAIRAPVEAERLPYRPEVLERLSTALRSGHRLVLATGSDELHAERVSAHLGIFTGLFASNGKLNLTGRAKAIQLQGEFGRGNFHYVGNDWTDLPVWQAAGTATIVGRRHRLLRRVEQEVRVDSVLGDPPAPGRAALRALRLHQWAKNLLVFVPIITSHQLLNLLHLRQASLAFLTFGMCASAIYIINDLFDIDSDRAHPTKRRRPFASAELSVPTGIVGAAALIALSLGCASLIGIPFLLVIVAYIIATTFYSARAKRVATLDVVMLALLYVLRVVAGGIATGIGVSNWLLEFALFLFLSLAFLKRYIEITATKGHAPGRGYELGDSFWLLSSGNCAGFMAVLILALYSHSDDVLLLYTNAKVLFLLCPVLLFWISHQWFRGVRQQLNDDPVLGALKDPISYVCGLASIAILFSAM